MKMVEQMRASGQGTVVLSCSDPRLNPYQVLGIDATLSKCCAYPSSLQTTNIDGCFQGRADIISEATMVRNAGGRAFDAIRTLAVLQTIGSPGTIVVMHHTGMSPPLPEDTLDLTASTTKGSKANITQTVA